jgi:hypothetical protein
MVLYVGIGLFHLLTLSRQRVSLPVNIVNAAKDYTLAESHGVKHRSTESTRNARYLRRSPHSALIQLT